MNKIDQFAYDDAVFSGEIKPKKVQPVFRDNNYMFYSRYGDKRYLQLEDGEWYFICAEGYNNMRVIGDYPDNISAIDPPGGPYFGVGNKFNHYVDVLPEHDFEIVAIKEVNGRWQLKVIGAKQTKFKKVKIT